MEFNSTQFSKVMGLRRETFGLIHPVRSGRNDADACYVVLFHSERIINKLSGLLVGKMLMHSFYELIGDDRYSTYCCEVS